MAAPMRAVVLRRSRRTPCANGDSARSAFALHARSGVAGSSASWRLYGPQGYDFRDLSKLAATITNGGVGLTNTEKFLRVHEWMDEHFMRTEVTDNDPIGGMDGALRRLNQYGGEMCGDHVDIVGNLLRYVPPLGSMYARKIDLSG